MEQFEDLRRFETVWQRVLPAMEPYPLTEKAEKQTKPEPPSVLSAADKPAVRRTGKRRSCAPHPAARVRPFGPTAAAVLLIAARCMRKT